jgi:class 3 adenylate cyclase/alpha-beta hydrolase superfamily lysophospholipase
MGHPETKYVTVGGAQVAYQVAGQGPEDLVFCHALGWQLDLSWQVPFGTEFMGRLRGARRVIDFDRRGSGASDPVPLNAIPTWEELAEDLTAVLDDVGSQGAAVMGILETGPIALLYAAMHPERVSHLILMSTAARYMAADDYPFGMSSEAIDSFVGVLGATWGTDDFIRLAVPSIADDAEVVAAYARMYRASATPRSAAAQYDYFLRTVDIRSFLPLVQAPTLVLQASETGLMPVEHGRYLAEHLPRATLIEWPGAELGPVDVDTTASDIIEFLTGERPVDVNRILTTVLFTDIVGSTERSASIGDQRWRSLLDAHDRAVREQLRRFKGREINTTGDGFVVSFDGPGRAIRCALAINQAMTPIGVDLRIGLHTGECEVRGDDLGGLAVHIAARIAALATSQEILVSSALKDLVIGSGIEFTERGHYDLKGVPGTWNLYAVTG